MSDVLDAPLARTDVVTTSNGPIRGYQEGGLSIFKGVRYAAPPTGARRFRPPERPTPWTQPADTVALGAPAVQVGVPVGETTGGRSAGDPPAPGQPATDEDCLFLNVWTPALSGARPVMVWLHGGGFANGSGGAAMYDGAALARRGDVVTVTVNHRLNVFGYLHLGELGGHPSSGEAGMLDIVMVLEWVRDNIARFGGDPGNVTIFGESGGGWKVSILQAMPAARGLFHKAIIQSGPGLTATPADQATKNARALLDILGVTPGDLSKLETLSAAEIQDAASKVPGGAGLGLFNPCVDGTALPRHPFTPDAPPQSADVPVLIGVNKDEATLFLRADPRFGEYTEEDVAKHARRHAGDKAEALTAALRAQFPDYSPSHLAAAIQTATGMWIGSVNLAERKAAQKAAPVYMYTLTWETPVARGSLRCPHALEIPLVFDNVEAARNFVGRGDDPQVLAEQMSEAWLAFARTGDPNTAALPDWPAYDADRRAVMLFDLTSRVENDPMAEVRKILQS
ncbi:carboxylesterase/lipase family protein [Caulobacter sp. KR2-114]|uniref:carboxylesterase/lipase family protein n=1 Tax=Caulobacter sp. KR2-114 TaxID=3400912 RepID=UPI003C054262